MLLTFVDVIDDEDDDSSFFVFVLDKLPPMLSTGDTELVEIECGEYVVAAGVTSRL